MHLNESEPATPGDEFLERVRRAGASVLGDSETGRQLLALCDDHVRARRLITQDRAAGALVLAVVGATGQGKSWLIRQMIRRSQAVDSIRSGNNLDEATEELVWVGPQAPADLDPRFERYVRVASDEMESVGVPYVLVDAPGATDNRAGIVDVAKRALSLASVIVLVVRRDQIRGETPAALAAASEGTIVIPMINAIGRDDAALPADIDAFVANLRRQAPGSIISRAIQVNDYELSGEDENAIGAKAAETLASQLKAELENNPDSDRRKSTRIAALDSRFRSALSALLADELPGLTGAVNRLNQEATKLPGEVAMTLIGADGPMQAAVRSRLRLKLLTGTAAIWFPYRSILGLLNLTHGAWDRVLLSLSGSLPSLVSTIWTSARSFSSDRNASEEVRDGLQRRSAAAVTDRLGPLASQFRDELAILRRKQQSAETNNEDGLDRQGFHETGGRHVAQLAGIDALQERSAAIFEDAVERYSITRSACTIMAVLGTLIFWALMAGPFVALYGEYLRASYEALLSQTEATSSGPGHALEHFPKPEFAMVLTSVVLSLLPTGIFAMIALSIAQSNRRTAEAMKTIHEGHEDAIDELQQSRVLHLRWDDPLLSDAEFLVSAGRR